MWDVEVGDPPEVAEPLLDLLGGQRSDPLGSEVFDVERSEHRAVGHRLAQGGGVIGIGAVGAAPVEVAEEAPGEAVAGAGRIAHVLE